MSVVIPLASKIHGREYYENLLKSIQTLFEAHGVKVFNVMDSEDLITDEVLNVINKSIPILLVLTGGTSRLGGRLITQGSVKGAIILAHGEHNSLPSAISIRSRADVEGIAAKIYFCEELRSKKCVETLEEAVRLGKALNDIVRTHVAVVSDSPEDYYNLFEGTYGIKLSLLSYEELERSFKDVSDEEVMSSLINLKSKLHLLGVNEKYLKDTLRVYISMKKLLSNYGYNAIAIDCFPFIMKYGLTPCLAVSLLNDDGVPTACEADLRSLLIMLMVKSLGVWPAWIANVSSVNGKRMVLSHCTIATKLGYQCSLLTHFESNYPYSLTCSIPNGPYTLASVDREFTTVASLKAKVVDSGFKSEAMCRTQVILESEVDLSDFPNIALSNHHVLIPGNISDRLKVISHMLGMDFITYESLIKYLSEV